MVERSSVCNVSFILRVVEAISSVVAFALVADYSGSSASKYNYIVFAGVSGFVVALAFMACYAALVARWLR
ncbi:hypothetical protein D9Q98_007422 [Chlorella vulgaris]|uniref:MARVEL domain-containing protein n=1 Tax=Chlorella vulgaris TaxID=3077 RepID=A0A9D4TLE0_CHLVU|nr:hypothetical protein D9Q98_007422 [Chlorella vulgaris]